jgi:hypothetical protein
MYWVKRYRAARRASRATGTVEFVSVEVIGFAAIGAAIEVSGFSWTRTYSNQRRHTHALFINAAKRRRRTLELARGPSGIPPSFPASDGSRPAEPIQRRRRLLVRRCWASSMPLILAKFPLLTLNKVAVTTTNRRFRIWIFAVGMPCRGRRTVGKRPLLNPLGPELVAGLDQQTPTVRSASAF